MQRVCFLNERSSYVSPSTVNLHVLYSCCTPTNLLSFLLGALGTLDSKMLGSARRQQCVTYRITLVLVLPIARNAGRTRALPYRPAGLQALVACISAYC